MDKEQIQMEKKRLRLAYGNLFESIAEILFRHDPMELNYVDNLDEYESEARTILPRLKTCGAVDDVIRVVHQEFLQWFDNDEDVGSPEKYRLIAAEIWELWLKHERQPLASHET